MRILVAGASGVVGRRLVPLLRERGHDVWGTDPSDGGLDLVRSLGAEAIALDLLHPESVEAALAAARPDAAVHLVTDLRGLAEGRADEALAATNRLRREGTRNLVRALAPRLLRRLVAASIGFTAADDDVAAAVAEHERTVLRAGGVVLRYGLLWGPGTLWPDGGAPEPRTHVDRAAAAAVEAVESSETGIVHVCD